MPKKEKHPKDMTTDEAIAHVFHPDALKHIKKHVKELDAKQARRSPKKSSK
jgi:hypothetical protein